ncbi:MAG: tRNA pseudouridine(55) synthase TruB [Alphaproteobacteria bacterium]|nr:tRNA pseudouridine(55) synthase TruB [Alphaproteobacteria bacterium]MDE2336947.1 tRNA pseudouridine(55) synthase TruB [Alphaproteobacteria bacterium]
MPRNKKGVAVNGWLNIDKPQGLTSTQVIGRVRRVLHAQKLGHAGTLDPLATGVLPIALGEATKTIPFAQDRDKVYEFTVAWGEARNTDDGEGEVTQTSDKRPTADEITAIIPRFIGDIEQTPPKFSAIKIDGQRAYDISRAGNDVEIKSRIVSIYDLRLTGATADTATFEMECGKGTYVRALARDMGLILGCFGYVSSLRRLAVGPFGAENAISLDVFEKMVQSAEPDRYLLPVETVLDDIPALALTDDEISRIKQGQTIRLLSRQDIGRLDIAGIDDMTDLILAIGDNKPLALLERDGIELHPVRVFNL